MPFIVFETDDRQEVVGIKVVDQARKRNGEWDHDAVRNGGHPAQSHCVSDIQFMYYDLRYALDMAYRSNARRAMI